MNKFENKSLEELIEEENDYFYRNGECTELDFSINDISRAKIVAFAKKHGRCWLGRINIHDCDRINSNVSFVEYTGQKIYNFQYEFVIPVNDNILVNLIKEHNREHNTSDTPLEERIDKIFNRLDEIGGIHLLWA